MGLERLEHPQSEPAAKAALMFRNKVQMGTYPESFPPEVMRLCLTVLQELSISITRKCGKLCRRSNRKTQTLKSLAKDKEVKNIQQHFWEHLGPIFIAQVS